MPYESLTDLVEKVEQESLAEQQALAAAAEADRTVEQRRAQAEQLAAEIFVEHGGRYEVSENYWQRLRDAAKRNSERRGENYALTQVSPWDKVSSNLIPLGEVGEQYGFAVISAFTDIVRERSTETYMHRGWFGVTREKTREVRKPVIESVSGYDVVIYTGSTENASIAELEQLDAAHSSYSHLGSDDEKFIELIDLVAKCLGK